MPVFDLALCFKLVFLQVVTAIEHLSQSEQIRQELIADVEATTRRAEQAEERAEKLTDATHQWREQLEHSQRTIGTEIQLPFFRPDLFSLSQHMNTTRSGLSLSSSLFSVDLRSHCDLPVTVVAIAIMSTGYVAVKLWQWCSV